MAWKLLFNKLHQNFLLEEKRSKKKRKGDNLN